jgi:hypothetical protein
MRKLVQGLRALRTWRSRWQVPTTSAMTQARQRLGPEVLRALFERVAVPCARRSAAGAWMSGRRLMSLDGFEVDVADSPANAERFGYSGVKKKTRAAFPKVSVVALAECGTHAIVAAEIGAMNVGEERLASQVLMGAAIESGMLVMVDRGLYSYQRLRLVTQAGADALFRVKADIDLPFLKWLEDGSYLSYVAEPAEKNRAYRRLRDGRAEITDLPGMYVRVVEYEVAGRGDSGEMFTLVTSVLDPDDMTALDLAAAYHERWEIELAFD